MGPAINQGKVKGMGRRGAACSAGARGQGRQEGNQQQDDEILPPLTLFAFTPPLRLLPTLMPLVNRLQRALIMPTKKSDVIAEFSSSESYSYHTLTYRYEKPANGAAMTHEYNRDMLLVNAMLLAESVRRHMRSTIVTAVQPPALSLDAMNMPRRRAPSCARRFT